jgi:beta-galactosidase
VVDGGVAARVEEFVAGGGAFVTSFLSGLADKSDNAFPTDAPGPLARVLGIRIDETDALAPGELNTVVFAADPDVKGLAGERGVVRFTADLVFDLVQPGSAEVVGVYESDFYAGMAAVTRNVVGDPELPGEAWYVGTNLDARGLGWLFERVLRARGLLSRYSGVPGVEAVARYRDDVRYLFLLNHGEADSLVVADRDGVALLTGAEVRAGQGIRLAGKDVVILKSTGSQ